MRKWIKEILREVIKEEIHNSALIISSRPPMETDIYEKGSIWEYEGEKFVLSDIKASWQKLWDV